MTIEKLSNYFYISRQVKHLQEKIAELGSIGSSSMDGMPHGTTISNPTEQLATKKIKLKNQLEEKLSTLYEEQSNIETFISSIKDIKVQTIVRMRFIQLRSWDDIAKELNYERTSPYYLLKKYLRSNLNEETVK